MEQVLAELRALVAGAFLPQAMDYERAARELSISVSQLRKLIRRGELAVVMIGRRPKVPASEVRRLTAVKAEPPTPRSKLRQLADAPAKSEADKIRALARRRTH
jgi:excisionase family DNA binding protein